MSAIKNKDRILQLVNEVPDNELAKVVSLMEELKKHDAKEVTGKYKAIYEIKEKFKNCTSNSGDFANRKAEEKSLDR